MSELLYWIWLSLSCTPGSDTFIMLKSKYPTPKRIFECTPEEIASVIGSKSKDYTALCDKKLAKAEEILHFCTSKNVGIVTFEDERFPASLREISNPPVLLYYRGSLPDFNNAFCITVVGTRRLSEYGRDNTYKVAYDLATAGATIVSGMALGIDGVALAGAFAAEKPCVAVLGCGINICYPKVHITLARNIVRCGCIITEFAPGTRPKKYNFPIRNRIMSALSKATVVMEGDERSGSLITARCAKEQDRDVYALPGNVGNSTSDASNLLIKNGAKLFMCADDIINDYDKKIPGKLNPFLLTTEKRPNMLDTLRKLEVSCVTPSDRIFSPSKSKKTKKNEESMQVSDAKEAVSISRESETAEPVGLSMLSQDAIRLYKKIPTSGDIAVEELIDDELTLPIVMQGLLTLEISRFITMLPGDRVKRNFK